MADGSGLRSYLVAHNGDGDLLTPDGCVPLVNVALTLALGCSDPRGVVRVLSCSIHETHTQTGAVGRERESERESVRAEATSTFGNFDDKGQGRGLLLVR